jgi:hypothetical protein
MGLHSVSTDWLRYIFAANDAAERYRRVDEWLRAVLPL